MLVEVIGGLWTNSIAILSDALHDLGDSLSLGVAWYFARISKKERTQKYTYGYKRFSVLGALINSIVLITGSIFIIVEAVPRLLNPESPNAQGMIYLAIAGVLVNGIAAFRLSKGASLNEKAVYTHLLEDVLGWVAVLIGAIVMSFWQVPIIDPVLSCLIAGYIIFNVVRNLKASFRIILQGSPADIKPDEIIAAMNAIPKVAEAHDCHIWSMDGIYHISSVHLVISENLTLSELKDIKKSGKEKMKALGINHTTIEFETQDEKCDPALDHHIH